MTGGAIRHAKLCSNRHHQQNQHPVFLQAGCPSCCPTNSVEALKENYNAAAVGGNSFNRACRCMNTMFLCQEWQLLEGTILQLVGELFLKLKQQKTDAGMTNFQGH